MFKKFAKPAEKQAFAPEPVVGGANNFQAVMESLPINVMLLDPVSFEITYANQTSIDTLRQLEQYLPIKADELVGSNVDIFHKNPAHQRRILSDASNLPWTAIISVGPEKLELNVNAIHDASGKYVSAALSWSIVTEKIRLEADTNKLLETVDKMPINVLMCDPVTFDITYANQSTITTLRPLEHLLSIRVDDLLGSSVDVFHKNPAHQRAIIGDPSRLPFRTRIKLGDETLYLNVEAIKDKAGNYISCLLTWDVITTQVSVEAAVNDTVDAVGSEAMNLKSNASLLESNSANSKSLAVEVATAAESTAASTQTVASATEELSASIREISQQASQASTIAEEAKGRTVETSDAVALLSNASDKIGEVVSLITDIANQTNLLALNATIEAARAGDAGKGFAVVASEVKNLATQTATATDDIKSQVHAIQSETKNVVEALEIITSTVSSLTGISSGIAAAVEEQDAATREISSSVQQAAAGAQSVSTKIDDVRQAAENTEKAASEITSAAVNLEGLAANLDVEVKRMLGDNS